MDKDKAKKKKESTSDNLTKKEFFKANRKITVPLDKTTKTIQQITKAVLKNSKDLKIIIKTMATKEDIKRVFSLLDAAVKKMEDFENKGIINTHRINEIEPKLEDHEKRITGLETVIQK